MKRQRVLPLSWVSRDGKIMISARSVRTFAQGSIAVLFAVYLGKLGFSLVQIGTFFSFGIAGGALFALLVSLIAEKVGRRRLLVLFTLTTAAAATVLVLTDNVLILTAFAFLGTLSGVGGGGGAQATQPLEQASLVDAAPAPKRTDLCSPYMA
jgi:MFS family permease